MSFALYSRAAGGSCTILFELLHGIRDIIDIEDHGDAPLVPGIAIFVNLIRLAPVTNSMGWS